MTDTPEQAQARRKFEAEWQKHTQTLEHLRAIFAEMERQNHPDLAWAREQLKRMEAVHEGLAYTFSTGGHIDLDELRAFMKR